MRKLGVSLVALVLLAGSSLGVAGQAGEEGVGAVFVTGTVVEDVLEESEGRVTWEQQVEWSDPRLPPTLRADADWYVFGETIEEAVMVVEIGLMLEDADGAWRGTGRGIESEDDRYSYYELVGEDAYEGMYVLLRGAPGHDANGPHDELYEGWLIEREPPPPA